MTKPKDEPISPEVSYLLYSLVLDDIGLYPKAVVERDGTRKERTEWQEGYNACVMGISKKHVRVREWYRNLDPKIKWAMTQLLISDTMFLNLDDEKEVKYILNVNDTFAPAADAERIMPEEIVPLYEAYRKYGWHGGLYQYQERLFAMG